jgi:hypothetical protein
MLLVALASALLVSSIALGQAAATKITDVQPASGKVNDTITVTGQNLGKPGVAGVFLSDDKNDYKAAILDQAEGKITAKVPELKPGDYNVSLQIGNQIIIEPVKFKVE